LQKKLQKILLTDKQEGRAKQGDQIGRIITPWVIVYIGQFFDND
jgi:hypothetical protein